MLNHLLIHLHLSPVRNSKLSFPFGTHVLPHILNVDIDPTFIDGQSERTPSSWEQINITFDISLSYFKTDQTSLYFKTYTDGLKCEQKVAVATLYLKDRDNSGAV